MDDTCKVMVVFLLVFGALIAEVIWVNHLNERQFIEHGYARATLPGIGNAQWVKQ